MPCTGTMERDFNGTVGMAGCLCGGSMTVYDVKCAECNRSDSWRQCGSCGWKLGTYEGTKCGANIKKCSVCGKQNITSHVISCGHPGKYGKHD